MLTRHFVGLTFYSKNLLSRKIDGFKKRYDPKYLEHVDLHMSLLAPFDINSKDQVALKEELEEEVEPFFFGNDEAPYLSFSGVDIHSQGKHNILYMNPNFSDDMNYLMESVRGICESFIPKGVKYKRNKKQFLPLGDFTQLDVLSAVMMRAHNEFDCNGQLFVSSICLFEKKNGVWGVSSELIKFDPPKDHLLHSSFAQL